MSICGSEVSHIIKISVVYEFILTLVTPMDKQTVIETPFYAF